MSTSPISVAAVFALFATAICNFTFFKETLGGMSVWSNSGLMLSIACFVFIISFAAYLLFAFKYTFKPFVILILCMNAVVIYFMQTYHIMIEKTMLENVFHTDFQEISELINLKMLYYFMFFAILPSCVLLKIKIQYPPFLRGLYKNMLVLFVFFVVTLSIIFINYPKFSTFTRENKDNQQYIVPLNYISGLVKYTKSQLHHQVAPIPILEDAKLDAAKKPTIFVLVVGETARAANFSLYGYSRETNPLLSKQSIAILNPAVSCGTSTAVSLPCIFSHLKCDDFRSRHKDYVFLPEALKKLAIQTHWVDNNFGGCYGVCDGVDSFLLSHSKDPAFCDETGCVDMILLEKLDQFLAAFNNQSMLIVLHMNGSHGPLYYKRYPPAFAKFGDACQKNNVSDCEIEQLVNAYDNTVLYTDYVLHTLIQKLKAYPDLPTVMLYASDHGESLGEHNLFLHGFPYAIAPKEQKEIPFLVFLSEAFKKNQLITDDDLQKENQNYSHDNIFHTILGAFGIKTKYYQQELDLLHKNN
jgi:lipid A ethanolaminephosphotransferase